MEVEFHRQAQPPGETIGPVAAGAPSHIQLGVNGPVNVLPRQTGVRDGQSGGFSLHGARAYPRQAADFGYTQSHNSEFPSKSRSSHNISLIFFKNFLFRDGSIKKSILYVNGIMGTNGG